MHFGPVPLQMITERDLEDLKTSIDELYEAEDIEKVKTEFLEGRAVLWRFTDGNGARAVMLIQETVDSSLYVWHHGGRGTIKHRHFILNTLEEYCRLRGLKRIKAVVHGKGLARMGQKLGFEPTLVTMVKEISDG